MPLLGKGGKPDLGVGARLPFDIVQAGRPIIGTVFSPSGGVGKSSMAMNLAVYIATQAAEQAEEYRVKGGFDKVHVPRVLVLDGDIVHGSLALRLTRRTTPNLAELAKYIDEREQQGYREADAWPPKYNAAEPPQKPFSEFVMMHNDLPNLNLLAAPEKPDLFWGFKPKQYRDVLRMLARWYSVIIIDSGTEIVMQSQRAWLSHANHVFLLTAPDIDRVWNAGKAAGVLAEQKTPAGGDTLNMPLPHVPYDRMSVVMTRYDAETGLDPDDALKTHFKWADKDDIFRIPDVAREMSRANNKGRFLVLENPGYAEIVGRIANRLFRSYSDQLDND